MLNLESLKTLLELLKIHKAYSQAEMHFARLCSQLTCTGASKCFGTVKFNSAILKCTLNFNVTLSWMLKFNDFGHFLCILTEGLSYTFL